MTNPWVNLPLDGKNYAFQLCTSGRSITAYHGSAEYAEDAEREGRALPKRSVYDYNGPFLAQEFGDAALTIAELVEAPAAYRDEVVKRLEELASRAAKILGRSLTAPEEALLESSQVLSQLAALAGVPPAEVRVVVDVDHNYPEELENCYAEMMFDGRWVFLRVRGDGGLGPAAATLAEVVEETRELAVRRAARAQFEVDEWRGSLYRALDAMRASENELRSLEASLKPPAR